MAQVMDPYMTQPGGINGRGEVAAAEVRDVDQASFGAGEQRCVTNRPDRFDTCRQRGDRVNDRIPAARN